MTVRRAGTKAISTMFSEAKRSRHDSLGASFDPETQTALIRTAGRSFLRSREEDDLRYWVDSLAELAPRLDLGAATERWLVGECSRVLVALRVIVGEAMRQRALGARLEKRLLTALSKAPGRAKAVEAHRQRHARDLEDKLRLAWMTSSASPPTKRTDLH